MPDSVTNLVVATVFLVTNQVASLMPSGEQKQVVTTESAVVSVPIVRGGEPFVLVSTNVISVRTNNYVWREPPAPPRPPLFQERKNQTNDFTSPRSR